MSDKNSKVSNKKITRTVHADDTTPTQNPYSVYTSGAYTSPIFSSPNTVSSMDAS